MNRRVQRKLCRSLVLLTSLDCLCAALNGVLSVLMPLVGDRKDSGGPKASYLGAKV